eukprot:3449967-Pyramimonas_sp.AAC.1
MGSRRPRMPPQRHPIRPQQAKNLNFPLVVERLCASRIFWPRTAQEWSASFRGHPEMASTRPNGVPRWANKAPRKPGIAQKTPKRPPREPQQSHRMLQRGPERAPTRPQDGPSPPRQPTRAPGQPKKALRWHTKAPTGAPLSLRAVKFITL